MPDRKKYVEAKVLLGLVLSELMGGVRVVAVPLLVYGHTGSLTNAALVSLFSLVPAVVVGIVGAPALDRMDRRKFIIGANVARFVLLGAIPFVWNLVGVPYLMAVAFVTAALGALEQPALFASLPALFGDHYQEFIGRRVGLSFLVQAVAPLAGGMLVGVIGATTTLGVCAIGYLAYAFVMVLMPPLGETVRKASDTNSIAKDLAEALRWTRRNPAVRTLLPYWLFSWAAVPLGVMTAVPYITTVLGRGPIAYGVASACYGAASVVSSIVAGKMKFPGGPRRWLIGAGVLYGAVNIAMLAHPPFIAFCVLWVIWGIAYGPEEVVTQLVFVKAVSVPMQGRLFSLMNVVMTIGSLIGTAVVGPMSDKLGATHTMAVAGVIFIAATLFSFAFGRGARAIASLNLGSSNA